jgi:hypothetical protein
MKSSLAKAPAQEKRKKSELLPNWCGVEDRFPQMTKVKPKWSGTKMGARF